MSNDDAIVFHVAQKAYRELANFYVTRPALIYRDKEYRTVEHLYQAMKFLYEGASEYTLLYAEQIRLVQTPLMAKLLAAQKIAADGYAWRRKLNQDIENSVILGVTIDPRWHTVRADRLREALLVKFTQNAKCRQVLLSTGDRELVERTPILPSGLGGVLAQLRSDLRERRSAEASTSTRKEADGASDEREQSTKKRKKLADACVE